MITAEWCKQLPNGDFITESQIFSPFLIYRDSKNYNRFLLIPNNKQKNIKDIFIFVNSEGFRLCNRNYWNKFLPPNACITTQASRKLLRIRYDAIYGDIREMICKKLANLFEYNKAEDGMWQLKLNS